MKETKEILEKIKHSEEHIEILCCPCIHESIVKGAREEATRTERARIKDFIDGKPVKVEFYKGKGKKLFTQNK